MITVFVEGVAVLGPGLQGWGASRKILAGNEAYDPQPLAVAASQLLPASERRRAGLPVRLALAAAEEAFANAGRDPAATATVFASSSGDGDNMHRIFEDLVTDQREISPTRFHNSVHNAAAGYWSIATRCRAPSTSLCGHDQSFAAGLLDAATQAVAEDDAVAVVAYDQPYPEPLHAKRPLAGSFAVALVMAPRRGERTIARLEVALRRGEESSVMPDAELERLRAGIPAARSLPLLAALSRAGDELVRLQHGRGRLEIAVSACR